MSGAADAATEFGTDAAGKAQRWIAELKMAEKELNTWRDQARRIVDRYRDERQTVLNQQARFNVLWSNVQTLLPAIYAKPPSPVVQRRFRDADPVGRAASTILQRSLQQEIDVTDLHQAMRQVVLDYLLVGRGTTWERYEPHFDRPGRPGDVDAAPPPDGGLQIENDGSEADEELAWEQSITDYVNWEDFLHSPARTWEEVRWVARQALMTRDEGRARFGDVFRDVPLDWKPKHLPEEGQGTDNELFKRAKVYEIWNADDRRVYWVSQAYGERVLDERDDPLGLEGFFPCPRPLFGTTTNNTLIPLPDYTEYQDQALALDDLTHRIARVTEAVRVAGAYDASEPALGRVFDESRGDNEMIPVDNWSAFSTKGGIEGAMSFVPIEAMANVLKALVEVRSQVKSDLYEVTGIADILRGASEPEETATAQRIKGRYASMRLTDRQTEVARYVRDVLRIKAEVMCEHFSPDTLKLASDWQESELATDNLAPGQLLGPWPGSAPKPQAAPLPFPGGMQPPGAPVPPPSPGAPVMAPQSGAMPAAPSSPSPSPAPPAMPPAMPPPPIFEQAIALLKSGKLRGFRVDVEDRSTIAADDDAEKQQRVQFLEATGKFIQSAATLPPALAPAMVPLMGKMLLFGARAFRAGMELETAMEDAVSQLGQLTAQHMANPPPDPKLIVAQAQAAKMGSEAQLAQQKAQGEAQANQLAAQIKMRELEQAAAQAQATAQQTDQQHAVDVAKLQLDREKQADERTNAERDYQLELAKLEMDSRKIDLEHRKLEAGQAMEGQKLAVQQDTANRQLDAQRDSQDKQLRAEHGEMAAIKPEDIIAPVMEHMKGMQEQMQGTNENHAHQIAALGEHLAKLARPKRIVRDGSGRAVGVEHVG